LRKQKKRKSRQILNVGINAFGYGFFYVSSLLFALLSWAKVWTFFELSKFFTKKNEKQPENQRFRLFLSYRKRRCSSL